MEKKMISVHAFTVHIYTVIIVLLVALLAIVSLKYLHLKLAVEGFTSDTRMLNARQPSLSGSISDYAVIIATTIVANYPSGTVLLSQPSVLQNYVVNISKTLKRDVVVIDKSRKILSDTIAANVGGVYSYDLNHEIDSTMKDGVSRSFTEKSTDYPNGLSRVVVPVKDVNNQVIGAVIISNTTVSK